MIKHIVMWRFKDSAAGRYKTENIKKVKGLLEMLKDKIPEIQYLEVGTDFNKSDAASDLVLYTEFHTREALQSYQEHRDHLQVAAFLSEVSEERRVVDYETSHANHYDIS